jgi:hypothetical protein
MTALRKFLVQVDVEPYEQDIFAETEEQASEEVLRELQDAGLELYGMSIVEVDNDIELDDSDTYNFPITVMTYLNQGVTGPNDSSISNDDDADPFGDEDTEVDSFDAPECTCTAATVDVGQVDPACPYVTGKRS